MAQVDCFRCKGTGYIEKFSHIKGGICFTCGGDGKVNTFSTISLNRKGEVEPVRQYLNHSSNRDIATIFSDGSFMKLKEMQRIEAIKELRFRAKEYYDIGTEQPLEEIAKQITDKLDDMEKNIPRPYEDEWYYKNGKVDLVPVHWLKKFQGNRLRRSNEGMKEFKEELLKDGLKEVPYISIGQRDRFVKVGEGNHRMNAYMMMGMDFIPVRVVRNTTNNGYSSTFYDRMSRVPLDDYFPGDERPTKVFDTFYDHDYKTESNEANMAKIEQYPIKVKEKIFSENLKLDDTEVKGLYTDEESESIRTLVKDLMENFPKIGGEAEELEDMLDKYSSWHSKEEGVLVIKELSNFMADLGYNDVDDSDSGGATDYVFSDDFEEGEYETITADEMMDLLLRGGR